MTLQDALSTLVCVAFVFAGTAKAQEEIDYGNPRSWGGECQTGRYQSPVELSGRPAPYDARTDTPSLLTSYSQFGLVHLKHTGPTVEVVARPGGGKLRFNGVTYNLVQTHFHTPPEHKSYLGTPVFESHAVHVSESGRLLVFAKLWGISQHQSTYLEPIIQNLKNINKDEEKRFNASFPQRGFVPNGESQYYFYTGSKTTPPCDPNVIWLVQYGLGGISQQQLNAYKEKFLPNARPLQPRNGRETPICCDGKPIPPERAQRPF